MSRDKMSKAWPAGLVAAALPIEIAERRPLLPHPVEVLPSRPRNE